MSECGCGRAVRQAFHALGCLECGAPCCVACAISLESAVYCRACAEALLDAALVQAGGPFDLV